VWNSEWTDSDEWRRAFEDLKKSARSRRLVFSLNAGDPDSGLSLVRTGLVDSVQVVYNIFDQTPEAHLFPVAVENRVGVLARVPLDEARSPERSRSRRCSKRASFAIGIFVRSEEAGGPNT